MAPVLILIEITEFFIFTSEIGDIQALKDCFAFVRIFLGHKKKQWLTCWMWIYYSKLMSISHNFQQLKSSKTTPQYDKISYTSS